jgi:hypothetical protein
VHEVELDTLLVVDGGDGGLTGVEDVREDVNVDDFDELV